MSSDSLSLERKRSVFPRIYSFGCCKSFLMPLLRTLCEHSTTDLGAPPANTVDLPDQDHFLLQLAIGVELGADFVVEVE